MNLEKILAITELTLEEFLKIVDEWVTKGIILKENSALKEALVNFAEDLATFQTLVNSTMSENKRQSLEVIEKHCEMLNEKISELLTSNQQLESSIASKIQGFTEKDVYKRQTERYKAAVMFPF